MKKRKRTLRIKGRFIIFQGIKHGWHLWLVPRGSWAIKREIIDKSQTSWQLVMLRFSLWKLYGNS